MPQPSAILARPLRRRAGLDRLPGLPSSFPAFPRRLPLRFAFASTRLCRRFLAHNAPVRRPSPVAVPLRRFTSPPLVAIASLREHLASSIGPVLNPPPELDPGKPVTSRSATVRPFAALLGTIGLSRCPEPLAGIPACGGETIISSGASCRLRSEDPPTVRWKGILGRPILVPPNSTSSPCRRRSGVPFLPWRLPFGFPPGGGPGAPIT